MQHKRYLQHLQNTFLITLPVFMRHTIFCEEEKKKIPIGHLKMMGCHLHKPVNNGTYQKSGAIVVTRWGTMQTPQNAPTIFQPTVIKVTVQTTTT